MEYSTENTCRTRLVSYSFSAVGRPLQLFNLIRERRRYGTEAKLSSME